MAIVLDHFKIFGFEDAYGELENAHRTGKRQDDKARHIIAKLYSRPFKRNLPRAAKSPEKKDMLNGVRIVEDFSPSDFELRKKALPKMKENREKQADKRELRSREAKPIFLPESGNKAEGRSPLTKFVLSAGSWEVGPWD